MNSSAHAGTPRIDWVVVCMHQTAVSTGKGHKRRRPRYPRELVAVVRPDRRRFGGLRPRASLRAQPPHPQHGWEPTPSHRCPSIPSPISSTPARARFTWSSAAEAPSIPVERDVATPKPRCQVLTGVGKLDAARKAQGSATHVEEARAVVGVSRHRKPVRLRRVRRRPGTAWRHHVDSRRRTTR